MAAKHSPLPWSCNGYEDLLAAFEKLVLRVDNTLLADGSCLDTQAEHALLRRLGKEED